MNKNIDLKKFSPKTVVAKLTPMALKIRRYTVVIFIVVIVSIYSFLVWKINSLVSVEPSEDAVAEQLLNVRRLRVDQTAIDKILQLKDNNVSVKVLFDKYRNNPFQE